MSIVATFIVPHPPLIIPDIGRGEERHIQNTINAYHEIAKEIAKIKPDTIIISSPHASLFSSYFHISSHAFGEGDFRQFGAPQVKFKVDYDELLVNKISAEAKERGIPAGTDGDIHPSLDHGTMVPLFFINLYYKSYKLIRISPSGLSQKEHYKFGKMIQSVIPKDKKVVWVASGDLSHKLKKDGPYGLAKEGPIFDKKLTDAIALGDFKKLQTFNNNFVRKAAECGLNSFIMMSGAIDGYQVSPNLLSYEGTFGVGYAVAMFDKLTKRKNETDLQPKKQAEDPYVKLAKESLEYYVNNHKFLKIPHNLIDDLINNKAGVFVSIHKHGDLRGCVGTISPTTKCIAEEIIRNAVSAGVRDPRFMPIRKKELSSLDYKVDVLLPPETIKSIDELDVKKYGVIVNHNYKTGLLLPNLDGIDTAEDQVRIAKMKAGISDIESFEMLRFEVIRH